MFILFKCIPISEHCTVSEHFNKKGGVQMNLNKQVREIIEEARTGFYHCGHKKGVYQGCKCSSILDQAQAKLLQAFKATVLSEEKIRDMLFAKFGYSVVDTFYRDWIALRLEESAKAIHKASLDNITKEE